MLNRCFDPKISALPQDIGHNEPQLIMVMLADLLVQGVDGQANHDFVLKTKNLRDALGDPVVDEAALDVRPVDLHAWARRT